MGLLERKIEILVKLSNTYYAIAVKAVGEEEVKKQVKEIMASITYEAEYNRYKH